MVEEVSRLTFEPKLCDCGRPAVIAFDFDGDWTLPRNATFCSRCGVACGAECCGTYYVDGADVVEAIWNMRTEE